MKDLAETLTTWAVGMVMAGVVIFILSFGFQSELPKILFQSIGTTLIVSSATLLLLLKMNGLLK